MNRIRQYLALLGTFCILEAKPHAIATLEYFYASDGMITGRSINGNIQNYEYDKKGQLLAVVDAKTGQKVEQYVYDPAGNILKKTVNGKTTTYTYDKANQLVSSVCNGKETKYAYDAAGRMVKEGSKSYCYGYLDKVMSVQENGQNIASFTYHADGQIESATAGGKRETFLWDNLALIARDATQYVNEPYITGGNPILANDNILFNDMLGSTLSINGNPVAMTAFGETDNKSAMFTGKPYIGELGYVFLFRNYRAEEGKWQTMDPIGYPDGWNNLAYCNNEITSCIDWLGFWKFEIIGPSTTTGSRENGSKVKIPAPLGGGFTYIDYTLLDATISASGNNTSTLTLICSGSYNYYDTKTNRAASISISYSILYTLDDKGTVYAAIQGKTSKKVNNTEISFLGGINYTIRGQYTEKEFSTSADLLLAAPRFRVIE